MLLVMVSSVCPAFRSIAGFGLRPNRSFARTVRFSMWPASWLQAAGSWSLPNLARLPGNQIYQVEFSEKTFAFPQLPAAWHGLTILHLTDLHFHGTPDLVFFSER